MLTFPCAKINLGLNITSEREDGYHNLETVFFPVPLTDALEVKLMHNDFPSCEPCDLKITGNAVDCDEQPCCKGLQAAGARLQSASRPYAFGKTYSYASGYGRRVGRWCFYDQTS